MIVIPQIQPELLKDMEVNFGSTVAKAIWTRMIDHINWVNAHFPLGMIVFVHKNITPNSISWPTLEIKSNWQFCDGSIITHPDSPMLGQSVPDLRNKFIKHSATIGQTGGTETFNLSHNHTGWTGFTLDADYSALRTDSGDQEHTFSNHHHPISSDLGTFTKLPPYHELQPYMRVA